MHRQKHLSDFVIDVGELLNPTTNRFCEFYIGHYPLKGIGGLLLYFQHVPGSAGLVAMGIVENMLPSGLKQTGIVAFSSIESLKLFFPGIDSTQTAPGGYTGIPIKCGNLIVPVPITIPISYRIAALQQPDIIHVFKSYPLPPDATHEEVNNVHNSQFVGLIPFPGDARPEDILPHVIHSTPAKSNTGKLILAGLSLLIFK